MYLRNFGLTKMRLDNYLRSGVSQYPSTSNMVNARKLISNSQGGTFIILIDHR